MTAEDQGMKGLALGDVTITCAIATICSRGENGMQTLNA